MIHKKLPNMHFDIWGTNPLLIIVSDPTTGSDPAMGSPT
jgi:hypothetical protein